MEKQGGMAFGFRKTATAVRKTIPPRTEFSEMKSGVLYAVRDIFHPVPKLYIWICYIHRMFAYI